jgi:hypothetical protein
MISFRTAIAVLMLVAGISDRATDNSVQHFVFFNRDRERITEHDFLDIPAIAGAQLKYTWRELEPDRDRYVLEPLLQDLAFLSQHDKGLWVQLQDVSFDDAFVNVPDYLLQDTVFHGGVARQYEMSGDDESSARPGGWVARRWDPAVRGRFIELLRVLGNALDGRITGLNLAETAVEFGNTGALHPEGFTYEGYVEALQAIMTAARDAFQVSDVIVYANFMPGEWLPGQDRGYLRRVYEHAARLGIGVGGPDLLPHRRGQRNHSYPLIAARGTGVVAGVAVQEGNLDQLSPTTGNRVTVAELHRFARDSLRLDYVFWGAQGPHYSSEIIPYLTGLEQADAEVPPSH